MSDTERGSSKETSPVLDSALRNGLFVSEGESVRSNPGFTQCLEKHCKMRSDLGNEEILYGMMLAIREFAQNLSEPDFLAARRIAWRYVMGLRERWREHPPRGAGPIPAGTGEDAPPSQGSVGQRAQARTEHDTLTYLYELQLKNAREIIASGDNFQPELLMYRERDIGAALIQGEDPVGQAIEAILSSKPEGYSFAAEAWRGPIKEGHKRGDIAKSESKTESFIQMCAENGGPYLSRGFTIDRAERILVQELDEGETRMPTFWRVDDAPAWYFD